MNIYGRTEKLLLKDWMEHTGILRGRVGYLVLSPLISERLKFFLGALYGPQWQAKFIRGNEMLQAQLEAYVSCYSGLTGFQRVQWDRFFPTGPRWSSGLSWRRWLSPAASSRWSRPSGLRLVVESLLARAAFFTVLCSSLWEKFGVARKIKDMRVFKRKRLNSQNRMQKLRS